MKNLIVFLLLFIPFSIIAQDKVESSDALMNQQSDKWMNKISSDSEMRGEMLAMMIEKTKGNEVEMQKLVNSFLANAELEKMMTKTNNKRANNETVFVESRGVVSDSIKVGKMNSIPPMQKK